MRIDAFDPDKADVEPIVIEATLDRFTIVDLGAAASGAEQVVAATFGGFGLRVEVLRTVYERVQRSVEGQVQGLGEDIQEILRETPLDELRLLPDGTSVATDWTQVISTPDWFEEPML